MEQRYPAGICRQPLPGRLNSGQVPVNPYEAAGRQPAQELQRVACPAQRTVQIRPRRLDVQRLKALLQQHRLMSIVLFHIRIPAPP